MASAYVGAPLYNVDAIRVVDLLQCSESSLHIAFVYIIWRYFSKVVLISWLLSSRIGDTQHLVVKSESGQV